MCLMMFFDIMRSPNFKAWWINLEGEGPHILAEMEWNSPHFCMKCFNCDPSSSSYLQFVPQAIHKIGVDSINNVFPVLSPDLPNTPNVCNSAETLFYAFLMRLSVSGITFLQSKIVTFKQISACLPEMRFWPTIVAQQIRWLCEIFVPAPTPTTTESWRRVGWRWRGRVAADNRATMMTMRHGEARTTIIIGVVWYGLHGKLCLDNIVRTCLM